MTQGNREVILERKQAVVLFAGGVIALILVFVLGVLFGRNMANRAAPQAQSQLAQQGLEPEKPKPVPIAGTEAPVPSTGDTAIKQKIDQQKPPEPAKPLKGETVTKAPKPPLKETKPGTVKGPEPVPPTTVKPGEVKKPETKPGPGQPATPVKPVETKPGAAKPVETKPTTAKPAETKPATPTTTLKGGFAIQVAAYPDKAAATELVNKLKANKWPSYSVATQVPGKGTYHRINLGPYSSKEQAGKALAIFKSKESKYKDAFVKATE